MCTERICERAGFKFNFMSPPRRRLKKLLQIGVGIKANSRASELVSVCKCVLMKDRNFPLFLGIFLYVRRGTYTYTVTQCGKIDTQKICRLDFSFVLNMDNRKIMEEYRIYERRSRISF